MFKYPAIRTNRYSPANRKRIDLLVSRFAQHQNWSFSNTIIDSHIDDEELLIIAQRVVSVRNLNDEARCCW